MVSIDTGFVAILVAVLCCHGYETDLNKREKLKRQYAQRERERENKRIAKATNKEAKQASKERKKARKAAFYRVKIKQREDFEMDQYRHRELIPEDFVYLTNEEFMIRWPMGPVWYGRPHEI